MFKSSFGAVSSIVDPPRSSETFNYHHQSDWNALNDVEHWLDSVSSTPFGGIEYSLVMDERAPTETDFTFGSGLPAFPQYPSGSFTRGSTIESRPMDGFGSNESSPEYGAAGTNLSRLAVDSFSDDGETLAGANRPNARLISNTVMRQELDTPNSAGASDFLWIWGQFLDHDIGLTEAGHTDAADIPVPLGDPEFDPFGTGLATIGFNRVDDADSDTPGRQYENALTAYIDGSQIYGSSDAEAAVLRVDGGKVIMTPDGYLEADGDALLTGDIRAAENIALTSMHTLFAREHNRLAEELAAENPAMDDDTIFTEARARVEAVMQAITFNEFLPLLLGENAIDAYSGYDASVDPGLSVEFTGAVFRLGHTLLSPQLRRIDEGGDAISAGHIALRDAFFAPEKITDNGGIDPILRGGAEGASQELDSMIVEDVRSFLFGPPGASGFDLAALNIQRGRDVGLPTYNGLREALGLDAVTSFDEITSDAALAAALESAYGNVDMIDLWVGGLAEDAVAGAMLGETFSVVLIDQFTRLRDGDAFWSEGRGFGEAELNAIWSTTLSDVIVRNTDIDHLQREVMLAHDRIGGTDGRDFLKGGTGDDLIIGFGGHDLLRGGNGNDELFGGGGRDKLIGGNGDDIMTGGAGVDTFIFDANIAGADVIADFERRDELKIKNLDTRNFIFEREESGDGYVVHISNVASIKFEGLNQIGWVLDELFS